MSSCLPRNGSLGVACQSPTATHERSRATGCVGVEGWVGDGEVPPHAIKRPSHTACFMRASLLQCVARRRSVAGVAREIGSIYRRGIAGSREDARMSKRLVVVAVSLI